VVIIRDVSDVTQERTIAEMTEKILTEEMMEAFETYLTEEERSKATIEKYRRDIRAFYNWLPEEKEITKECMMKYKQMLSEK